MPNRADLIERPSATPKNAEFGEAPARLPIRDASLRRRLLRQLARALYVPEQASRHEREEIYRAALAAVATLEPRDEAETLLAVQMVAAHHAALDCLARAAIPGQSLEARDVNLRYGFHLLSTFGRQFDSLQRRRGASRQRITVEHIQLEGLRTVRDESA